VKGMYLYAVMAGERFLDLGPCGVPDGNTAVVSVSAHALTAVVSTYEGAPLSEFSRTEIFGRLVIHQRVIEQVNDESTVLPARFGTVLSSEDEVRLVLERFHDPLARALREVDGAVEVDLSATWDTNALFTDIAQEPAVAALTGAVSGGPPDENLAAQVRVGMLVQEATEKRREEYRRRIVGDLVSFTRDAQPNPLLTDDLVVNLALLVDRSELPAFDAAVDRLGEELGDRLTFRYVGPLPPYSFATVDVILPTPVAVESARRTLGLGERCTKADLQSTYRRLAGEAHPDRNPGDRAAQDRFALLTSARDALHDFISGQSVDEAQLDPGYEYDLTPETVARTLLLQISRADTPPSSLSQTTNEPDLAG
jgi:hypothetical protein